MSARPLPTTIALVGAAPHRPMFLLGAAQLTVVMLVWLWELAGRSYPALAGPPMSIPATYAHTWLMLYGLFTFFMYGFLFTVFPRWTGASEIERAHYMAVALTAALGIVLGYAGLYLARPLLLAGLAFYLAAWVGAIAILVAVYARAPKRSVYEVLLIAELVSGAVGSLLFLYGVATGAAAAFIAARDLGLWGFLLPVLLTVSHRMIPFFTQSALKVDNVPRPRGSLYVFVGGLWLHGIFEATGALAARLVVDVLLAGFAFHHTIVWQLTRSFASRLLAMLHVAFLWFGIGMALYAVQAALALAGVYALGRAPLHALGIGFVTGTLIAMATRVTLGHSGQALAVKAPTWYLFLGLNLVALLRIAAELTLAAYAPLNLLAALAWLACLLPWTARYLPIYLRPRVDHRPG